MFEALVLSTRGLGLGADAGDPQLGVLLPVAQTAPVAGLVPVLDHVDLGAGRVTDDVRRDLVAADLGGVADDPVAVDDQQGGQRDARPGLAVQLVDGDDVIQRDLFLPAAAAHNRVHPRTLFRRAFLACPGAPVVTTAARLHIGARSAGNSRPPRLPDRGASTNPGRPARSECRARSLAETDPMGHRAGYNRPNGPSGRSEPGPLGGRMAPSGACEGSGRATRGAAGASGAVGASGAAGASVAADTGTATGAAVTSATAIAAAGVASAAAGQLR